MSETTENVRALPLYGQKLVDWRDSLRAVCIQAVQKLNVILSVFERLGVVVTTGISHGALSA